MDATTLTISENTIAQKIHFAPETLPGIKILAKFVGKKTYYALAEISSPEYLLAPENKGGSIEEVYFLFLPFNSSDIKWAKQAEKWMAQASHADARPTIELNIMGNKIFWRPRKAVVMASAERRDEIMRGLVEFSFYEGRLRKMETQILADSATAQNDIALTHAVKVSDLKRQGHVNERTYQATLARMEFVELQPHLEHPDISLPGLARRVASELAVQAEVFSRLEIIDDQLEVLEDLYELANDRLTEFRYFREECILEGWVIFLLVLEVVLLVLELFQFWFHAAGS